MFFVTMIEMELGKRKVFLQADKKTPHLCSQSDELVEVSVVVFIQSAHILAVGDQPVDRRKVLTLSKLFVQAPEHL